MTIAACYLSAEGVVFGADSTTTISVADPTGKFDEHYFDYGQKVYEIGCDSQLGVVIWGQGSFLQVASYRTLIAEVGDELDKLKSVEEVAARAVRSMVGSCRDSACWRPRLFAAVVRLRVRLAAAAERRDVGPTSAASPVVEACGIFRAWGQQV